MENINEFLQSDQWRKFQESVGRKTFCISKDNFYASIIEHKLPIAGKYFYVPRGPVCRLDSLPTGQAGSTLLGMTELINLAKKEKASWIRIDTDYKNGKHRIVKAPHDMQPKEVFIIDIAKSEEELLAEMKAKTRYNIRVAQKHGVSLRITNLYETTNNKDVEEFLRLVKVTAKRDGITPHPESYYRKMFETIPAENLKLYVAEYENKIIAANIIIFYGNTATYLHGASDNNYRNVMAPYLLQWQAISDAKKAKLEKYDFGGVKTNGDNSWAGITKFKTGFSPNTKPMEFLGSYDIVINPFKYYLYRVLQKSKSII